MTGTPEELVKWLFGQDKNKLFDVKEHDENHTPKAMRFLWACLGDLARALNNDKWTVYLQMLKRYGIFTYACLRPNKVEAFKQGWRECEEIGTVTIGGEEAVQVLCYLGASRMSKKELSALIQGVTSEMYEMGLDVPNKELERIVKQLEENNGSDRKDESPD